MFLLCCSLQVLPLQYTYSLHHGQKAHFCSHSTPADRCVCCNISVQSECSTQAHTYTHRDQPLPVPALLCAEGSGCWRVTTTLLFSALVYSSVGNSGSPWQAAVVVDKKKVSKSHVSSVFTPLASLRVHRNDHPKLLKALVSPTSCDNRFNSHY